MDWKITDIDTAVECIKNGEKIVFLTSDISTMDKVADIKGKKLKNKNGQLITISEYKGMCRKYCFKSDFILIRSEDFEEPPKDKCFIDLFAKLLDLLFETSVRQNVNKVVLPKKYKKIVCKYRKKYYDFFNIIYFA